MSVTMGILVAVTMFVNLPAIFAYALPGLRRTDDAQARAALLYTASRSAALAIAAVVALWAVLAGLGSGWLLGVAVATAVVQAIDVPIAATTGEPSRRAAIAVGAVGLCALEVAAIILVVTVP